MYNYKKNPLETSLVNEKVLKTDIREIALGAIDELQAYLMDIRNMLTDDINRLELETISGKLMILMGEIAGGKCHLEESDLLYVVDLIKKYQKDNGVLTEFRLPGLNSISSRIHIARTVSRRAELEYAKLYEKGYGNDLTFEYLNKLSLYLYDLAVKYDE